MFFDHDYADELLQKRKAYTLIKRTLKEKNICFQTPLTRMRVHFSAGIVTYQSTADAEEDLNRRDFTIDKHIPQKDTADTMRIFYAK